MKDLKMGNGKRLCTKGRGFVYTFSSVLTNGQRRRIRRGNTDRGDNIDIIVKSSKTTYPIFTHVN